MPKLTLSAEKAVIERAKQLAAERGISVSAMFSQFVASLGTAGRKENAQSRRHAPITRRVRGLAKVTSATTDRELYEAAILDKARR